MKRMLLCWNAYWNKYLILLQIMNLYFWKSLLGPIMSFIVVPLLSLGFLLINSDYVNTIMPSVISNPLIFLPFWFLISAIYDLKKNSIVEKIFIFSKKTYSLQYYCYTFFIHYYYYYEFFMESFCSFSNIFK